MSGGTAGPGGQLVLRHRFKTATAIKYLFERENTPFIHTEAPIIIIVARPSVVTMLYRFGAQLYIKILHFIR